MRDRTALREQDVVAAHLGSATPSVWSGRGRRPLARMADAAERESAGIDRAVQFAAEIRGRRHHRRRAAGNGRLEPGARGDAARSSGVQRRVSRICTCSIRPIPDRFWPSSARSIFARTLFLVASKSGSTLEVNILKQHFFHRAVQQFGEADAGQHFVLTTDPGSKLEQIARAGTLPRHFPGRAERRRPLLGAVELRARSGGADRHRRVHAARSRARDGAPLRVRRP